MRPLALSERLDFAPTLSLAELLAGESAPLTGDTDQTLQDYSARFWHLGFQDLGDFLGGALKLSWTATLPGR